MITKHIALYARVSFARQATIATQSSALRERAQPQPSSERVVARHAFVRDAESVRERIERNAQKRGTEEDIVIAKHIALYARVSSERQAQQATTATQSSALRERAQPQLSSERVVARHAFVRDAESVRERIERDAQKSVGPRRTS